MARGSPSGVRKGNPAELRSPVLSVVASGRRWRSADLFGRQQEIEIEHGQAIYRLRLTALGKLILTK